MHPMDGGAFGDGQLDAMMLINHFNKYLNNDVFGQRLQSGRNGGYRRLVPHEQ